MTCVARNPLFPLIISVFVFHIALAASESNHVTPCNQGNETLCLEAVRDILISQSWWFGETYSQNCPESRRENFYECWNPSPNLTTIIERALQRTDVDVYSIEQILKIRYNVPAGTYHACGQRVSVPPVYMSSDLDPTFTHTDLDLWTLSHRPAITWSPTPGKWYTLAVFDVGEARLAGLWVNIPGGDAAFGQELYPYSGPASSLDRPAIAVFTLFEDASPMPSDQVLDLRTRIHDNAGQSGSRGMVRVHDVPGLDNITKNDPIAVGILAVKPDAFGIEKLRQREVINSCPSLLMKSRPELQTLLSTFDLVTSAPSLDVDVEVDFYTEQIDYTSCCVPRHQPAGVITVNSAEATPVKPVFLRNKPSIHLSPVNMLDKRFKLDTFFTVVLVDVTGMKAFDLDPESHVNNNPNNKSTEMTSMGNNNTNNTNNTNNNHSDNNDRSTNVTINDQNTNTLPNNNHSNSDSSTINTIADTNNNITTNNPTTTNNNNITKNNKNTTTNNNNNITTTTTNNTNNNHSNNNTNNTNNNHSDNNTNNNNNNNITNNNNDINNNNNITVTATTTNNDSNYNTTNSNKSTITTTPLLWYVYDVWSPYPSGRDPFVSQIAHDYTMPLPPLGKGEDDEENVYAVLVFKQRRGEMSDFSLDKYCLYSQETRERCNLDLGRLAREKDLQLGGVSFFRSEPDWYSRMVMYEKNMTSVEEACSPLPCFTFPCPETTTAAPTTAPPTTPATTDSQASTTPEYATTASEPPSTTAQEAQTATTQTPPTTENVPNNKETAEPQPQPDPLLPASIAATTSLHGMLMLTFVLIPLQFI